MLPTLITLSISRTSSSAQNDSTARSPASSGMPTSTLFHIFLIPSTRSSSWNE